MPVLEHTPPCPVQRRPRAGLFTQFHVNTFVAFLHLVPYWQKWQTISQHSGARARCWINGDCHNIEVCGFSKAHGSRALRQARINCRVTRAVLLPSWIFWTSNSLSPGRPRGYCDDRRVHQGDPGGPRLARDQELHGVPNQTLHTQCDCIQPWMSRTTQGRQTSKYGPTFSSKAMAPHPRAFQAAVILPDPANSSKNT